MTTAFRRGHGQPIAYFTNDGTPYAASGSPAALYVQIAPTAARIELLNPAQAAVVPLLQALAEPGYGVEVFAADFRDPALNPPQVYLMVFDSIAAPVSGTTQPLLSALPVCRASAYDWTGDHLPLSQGLWVAISSNPLIYTAMPASQDFSITARVLP